MSFFTPQRIQAVTDGRWLQPPPETRPLAGVGIDTRAPLAGKCFIAIAGDRHDGHVFTARAAEAGAPVVVVHEPGAREPLPESVGVLRVDDTCVALGRLAQAYRRTLTETTVIAITGSAGKTTTKALVHSALSPSLRGSAAPRSFNNAIGVPLTLLAARPRDRYVVVEIGTSGPGEVGALAALAEPDLAIITMVGRGHLAGLGSVAAVAEEKVALLAHLRTGGLAIVNDDAGRLASLLPGGIDLLRFGLDAAADLRLTDHGAGERGWWFEVNGGPRFELSLPGRHNAVNSLAAVAAARRLGIDDEQISRGLAVAQSPAMRMSVERIEGMTVYNDAYNANPDSMIAAIDTFVEVTKAAGRRVVVLGDMLELGPAEVELHREIGAHLVQAASRCPIDEALFVGPRTRHAAEVVATAWGAGRVTRVDVLDDEATALLASRLLPSDTVLVKGSRGMALERLVERLGRPRPEVRTEAPTGAAAPRPTITARP